MTTTLAIAILLNHRGRNATFIGDPENGDSIRIHDDGEEAVEDILGRLDWEIYEGDGPTVTVN